MEGGSMSSIINALYELKYNPFKYGEYIASFYSTIHNVDNNILLANLVIPLCSHPIFGRKLKNANIKSSIWTIFDDPTKLYDLQERIYKFQGLTEQCIQYCLVNDWIYIETDSLTISFNNKAEETLMIQKNAMNLGRLLSGHSVVEIFSILGVKP